MKKLIIILYFIGISCLYSQNPQWLVYNSTNSGLPNNEVKSVAVDLNSVAWIGTAGGGIAAFDGSIWTVFNATNSGFSDYGNAIAVDSKNNKWIASINGLGK